MTSTHALIGDQFEALLRQGRFSILLHSCERTLAHSNSTPQQRSQAQKYLALALFRSGDIEGGLRAVREMEQMDTSELDRLTLNGLGHLLKNDSGTAEQLFRRALTINDQSTAALSGLGWCTRERDPQASWEYFSQALRIDPSYRDALRGICTLPFPEGGEVVLEQLLRSALDLDPFDSNARVSLAVCLYTLGRIDEAQCEVTKVTLVDPTIKLAVELKNKLAEIAASNSKRGVSE